MSWLHIPLSRDLHVYILPNQTPWQWDPPRLPASSEEALTKLERAVPMNIDGAGSALDRPRFAFNETRPSASLRDGMLLKAAISSPDNHTRPLTPPGELKLLRTALFATNVLRNIYLLS